jgi:hypothetical protein
MFNSITKLFGVSEQAAAILCIVATILIAICSISATDTRNKN